MNNKINISELVCTRISHDLIGNIGAFANAVELLEDDDDEFMAEIKSTLKMSSDTLTARLKFFRMAFGLNNASLEQNDLVAKTINDYIKTLNPAYPIKLNIKQLTPKFNRMIMLAAMSGADVLIRGGEVAITSNDNEFCLLISGSNFAKTKIEAIIGICNNIIPNENLSLYAPLFYLQELLEKIGKKISLKFDEVLEIKMS